jgi:hypothetical protein
LKLAEKPKVHSEVFVSAGGENATEITISPGETISAIVKVERSGFEGEINFGSEYAGRNLPHGVYIDNIGLNGMTLLAGESEREFFITAAKWVPETTRPFHTSAIEPAQSRQWPGDSASLPAAMRALYSLRTAA